MRALPTAEETVPVVARIEPGIKAALIEQARSHGRSLSAELRELLRENLVEGRNDAIRR